VIPAYTHFPTSDRLLICPSSYQLQLKHLKAAAEGEEQKIKTDVCFTCYACRVQKCCNSRLDQAAALNEGGIFIARKKRSE